MNIEVIITAIVGVVATFSSSFFTWLFSKKKYNAEVDRDKISNMEASLSFYEKLTESNNKILTDILDKSEKLAENNVQLMIEVQNLRAQVDTLTNIINTELKGIDLTKYGLEIKDGKVTGVKKPKKLNK